MSFSSRLLSLGCLLGIIAMLLAPPATAQVSIGDVGVSVGGNLETLDDVSGGNTTASFDSPLGYNLGITYDQPVLTNSIGGALSVRPGLVARRLGNYSFPGSIEGPGAALLQNEEFTLWMFEVPVDIRYRLPVEIGNTVSLYGLLGPQLSIPRAEQDFEATMEDVSYSINFGAGAEIDLPANLSLLPELRYELGVTDTFKDEFTYRFRDFTVQDVPSTGALNLRVHLTYDL